MNLFELGMFMTPVCGAIGGGVAAKTAGTAATVMGMASGLVVGGALLTSMYFLVRKLDGIPGLRRFNHSGAAAVLVVLIVPLLLPMAAFALSHEMCWRLFH